MFFLGEWKLFLESVLIEARAGLIERAASVALDAVQAHGGTGRLWAIYIQLCHRLEVKYFYETEAELLQRRLRRILSQSDISNSNNSADQVAYETNEDRLWLSKQRVILRAISQVPKSGEVWCESGRCHLNPLSVHCFDLAHAQRSLGFAIQFTPQYGDTFVEYVRLEMLCQVLLPAVLSLLQLPVLPFMQTYLHEDVESDTMEITRDARRIKLSYTDMRMNVPGSSKERAAREEVIYALEHMQYEFGNLSEQYRNVVIKNLNRRYFLHLLCLHGHFYAEI